MHLLGIQSKVPFSGNRRLNYKPYFIIMYSHHLANYSSLTLSSLLFYNMLLSSIISLSQTTRPRRVFLCVASHVSLSSLSIPRRYRRILDINKNIVIFNYQLLQQQQQQNHHHLHRLRTPISNQIKQQTDSLAFVPFTSVGKTTQQCVYLFSIN